MQPTTKQYIAAVELDALKHVREELDLEIARLEQIANPPDAGHLPADGTFTAELTMAIHDIFLEERPLRRQTILERLADQEIYVGGKDSLRTLSAYLSNDDRFIAAGRGHWTLKHLPENEKRVAELVDEGPTEREPMSQALVIAIEESDQMFRTALANRVF